MIKKMYAVVLCGLLTMVATEKVQAGVMDKAFGVSTCAAGGIVLWVSASDLIQQIKTSWLLKNLYNGCKDGSVLTRYHALSELDRRDLSAHASVYEKDLSNDSANKVEVFLQDKLKHCFDSKLIAGFFMALSGMMITYGGKKILG